MLLEAGAPVNAINSLQLTALHYAVQSKYTIQQISFVLYLTVDPILRVVEKRTEVVKQLLIAGADLEMKTKDGLTVYDFCASESEIHNILKWAEAGFMPDLKEEAPDVRSNYMCTLLFMYNSMHSF